MKQSIAVILWAFLGLETACANSDTVENPEKNVPIAVLAGTLLAGACYTTSTAIIGGLVPYTELMNANAPFGLAYATMFGNRRLHRFLHARLLLLRIPDRFGSSPFLK